jgi:D-alanine-D-alanine ligase
MKINVAFVYGCRSVEHEVSIISAVQAMRAVNKEKYNVIPVYVDKNGEMYTGIDLLEIENYRNLP